VSKIKKKYFSSAKYSHNLKIKKKKKNLTNFMVHPI
jgi:hypothetical protein